jgi:hypothetical protein
MPPCVGAGLVCTFGGSMRSTATSRTSFVDGAGGGPASLAGASSKEQVGVSYGFSRRVGRTVHLNQPIHFAGVPAVRG